MEVEIAKSQICGSVTVPPSKSVAHRLMICAALAGNKLNVENCGKDVEATARCLAALFGDESIPVLNAGESGSTLRFLLPIVCALGKEALFVGEGRLKDRPIEGLIKSLASHGAVVSRTTSDGLPLKTGGKLEAGIYEIDGSVSSQYITGLLLALPLLDGDSVIKIYGKRVSSSYIEITLRALEKFGISALKTNDGFFVKGNQRYVAPDNLAIEGDWSSAGFMIALGVLAGETRLKGLYEESAQGDKIVVDLLKSAGAEICFDGDDLVAKKSALKAIDFDAEDCPDTVPIMAATLSFANGVSHISGVDRLKDKESDRLGAVRNLLEKFGIRTEYFGGVLSVYGGGHRACIADGCGDHRMAMSAAALAVCTDGTSVITGAECVDKSYPAFFRHISALGANIKIR